ncbi:MAG TPA: hypothetical protein VIK08_00095 [Candidatus Limnocylindrales bacterium]
MEYGKGSAQVLDLLDTLRRLAPADWKRLETAQAGWKLRDAAEDALAEVLSRKGLRAAWFELRATATSVARSAAADYAAQTHEGVRTIEHVAAVNAWDGQREASKLEFLGPAHERGFIDAACDALGVVLMRPYISASDFTRFWVAFLPVLG